MGLYFQLPGFANPFPYRIVRCNMRNLLAVLFRHAFLMLIFSILFTSALTASAQTQLEQDRARMRAERDLEWREWQLRTAGKIKKVDVNVEPPRVILGKVKEDYEGLQAANNDILKMLAAKKGLDSEVIFESATQIRKRSARLKSYLVTLQLVEDDERRRRNLDYIESEQMTASLLALDTLIMRLVASPVFKEFGKVVDLDNSTRTRKDLDEIIDLSERIKKSIERSIKAARASR